jgi:large subunit ribosomal protein L15
MTLLPKVVLRRNKRLGQGIGSGKGGHTSGRGQKGQKARTGVHVMFEGFKTRKSLFKRLPFSKGRGKQKAGLKPLTITFTQLEALPTEKLITVMTLVENGVIRRKDAISRGAKIVARGELTKKLNVQIPVSVSAREQIEKVGGSVTS